MNRPTTKKKKETEAKKERIEQEIAKYPQKSRSTFADQQVMLLNKMTQMPNEEYSNRTLKEGIRAFYIAAQCYTQSQLPDPQTPPQSNNWNPSQGNFYYYY